MSEKRPPTWVMSKPELQAEVDRLERVNAELVAAHDERLNRIRSAIVSTLGGTAPGSCIWSNSQWDKGYVAGIKAAYTAFDTERLKAEGRYAR